MNTGIFGEYSNIRIFKCKISYLNIYFKGNIQYQYVEYADIDWDLLNGESRQSTNFCELIVHLNLCKLIISSTHNAGNILDLILINKITLND